MFQNLFIKFATVKQTKQPSQDDDLPAVVKEEPPEDDPEFSSFCYETVTKEEVILEDQGQQEISDELPFKCAECKRSYDQLFKLNRCVRSHTVIKAGLNKCEFCGKCFATKNDKTRHEATHEKGTDSAQDNLCDTVIKQELIEESLIRSDEAAIPELVQHTEELSEESDSMAFWFDTEPSDEEEPPSAVTVKDKQSQQVDCKICGKRLYNKQSLKIHELTHRNNTESKNRNSEDATESESGDKDEISSHFRYETVTKEELIIEDDAFVDLTEDQRGEDQPSEGILEEQSAPKQMKCNVCHTTFDDEFTLQLHYKTHNPVVMRSMYEQLLIYNSEANNYICMFCENTYPSRHKSAIGHVQMHINIIDSVYQCKVCGLRLSGNYAYQNHIKKHTKSPNRIAKRKVEGVHSEYESTSEGLCEKSDRPLHCKTCDVVFNTMTNLNIHLWTSKLKIVRATIDADAIAAREQTVTHIVRNIQQVDAPKNKQPTKANKELKNMRRDETGFYNCSKCAYKTDKISLLRTHYRRHTVKELGMFTCDVCQLPCVDKRHLAAHLENHKKGNIIKCRTCNETFATRGAFYRHRVVHSKNVNSQQFLEKVTVDEKGVYTCTVCGKTNMPLRKQAFDHFRLHALSTLRRPTKTKRQVANRETFRFKCPTCNLRRPTITALKTHMKTHEKLRFKCHTCNEKFETRPELMRHRRAHVRNDIYKCSQCDETFPTRTLTIEHFRIHVAKSKSKSKAGKKAPNKQRS